jgi:truncated hemoglobin YjbI
MGSKDLPLEKPELRALGQALGEARIHEIIRRFYDVLKSDVLVGFFFDGQDLDRIAGMQSQFLYRAMGLRPSYTGLPPSSAHAKLPPILAGHFDRRLTLLATHLAREGLDAAQIATWVAFENAFRNSIIAP